MNEKVAFLKMLNQRKAQNTPFTYAAPRGIIDKGFTKSRIPKLKQTEVVKIAEDAEKEKKKAIAVGTGGTAAGASIMKKVYDKGLLTGRETLYHGTSPENAELIRKGGLLSKFTGQEKGNTEILKDINPRAFEKSLGKVYLTPDKKIARMYAGQTSRGGVRNLGPIDLLNIQSEMSNPLKNEGVVKAKVPTWKNKSIPNPEAVGTYDEFLNFHGKKTEDMSTLEKVVMKAQHDSLSKKTRVFKGDIPAEQIKGSNNFKRLTKGELVEYIKSNPKRFAKGVGGVALGAGIAGAGIYGAKKMIDRHKQMEKEAGIRDFISRIRKRFTKKPKLPQKTNVDWINEAGRNKQTLQLKYVDAKGNVTTRETEPYEIKDGHYWGYSLDTDSPGIRKFNLDRIQGVKVTPNKFEPRWEVKLANAMKTPSLNEGRWKEDSLLPEGEDKNFRRAYSRLRDGNRYTVNKSNRFIRMKLRGENLYTEQL